MSANNQEIPGFYRDPVTGKYYADRPGISQNPALKKLKMGRCSEEFNVTPKITSVVGYLNAREMRAIGGVLESKEYLKMRWNMKRCVYKAKLHNFPIYFTFPSVEFIFGSNHSVCGFWTEENYGLVGKAKLLGSNHNIYTYNISQNHVIDMCEGLADDFVVVFNPSRVYNPHALAACFGDYGCSCLISSRSPVDRNSKQTVEQIFCCCCNKRKLFHAFGSENRVICINYFDRETSHKIEGRIHTLTTDDSGDLMISGMHNGNLILYDFRTNNVVMNIEVSNSCLIGSSLINSNHLIVAGTDDVLCKVDIRKKEIVTEFLAHKQQSMKKAPFSIANNMLCAAGSDNRIRIWGLSGGLPLHEIKPDDPQKNIRGWLCEIGNKPNLYCYEGIHQKLFKIM